MAQAPRTLAARAVLRWHLDMGVDEAVGSEPHDWRLPADEQRLRPVERPSPPPAPAFISAPPPGVPADEAVAAASEAARGCATFDALAAAVAGFAGCGLKAGARTTVFTDGVPTADLLIIGEAPGRDEDAAGKPFVGRAGQLLDRMLATIGRSRATDALITNVVFWRPPGNRTPTQVEIAICRPFVDRLIEIVRPKSILLAGGVPTQAMLGLPGIMRARGVWREIETAGGTRVPALPTLHPAFLLRQPAQKRLAWADLLSLASRLRDG